MYKILIIYGGIVKMVKNKILTMQCEKCKTLFEVSYDTFSTRRRLGRPHLCKECSK